MSVFHEELAVVLANRGAPTWLVGAAWEAGEDNRGHATLALELAQRLGVEELELEPKLELELDADLGSPLCVGIALTELLDEVIVTGCICQTLAAFELEILSSRSSDSDVGWILGRFGRDTMSHAELAWGVCRWMLRCWPELRDHARESFLRARGHAPTQLRALLPRLGLLSPCEREVLLERAQATVDVAAARLFGGAATARHVETWLQARRRPITELHSE